VLALDSSDQLVAAPGSVCHLISPAAVTVL